MPACVLVGVRVADAVVDGGRVPVGEIVGAEDTDGSADVDDVGVADAEAVLLGLACCSHGCTGADLGMAMHSDR